MGSLAAYETLAANLNELGDEFMVISIALGWAMPLHQAAKTELRLIPRAPKTVSILLMAVLSCLAMAQVQARPKEAPPLKPCGQWTDTDFMLAMVVDFSPRLPGRNFLAALGAAALAPPATVTHPAYVLKLIRDRDPNCCSVVRREIDDPIIGLIERFASPDEKTVEISLDKKDSKKYVWSFHAVYDFDRCGIILHRVIAFQQP